MEPASIGSSIASKPARSRATRFRRRLESQRRSGRESQRRRHRNHFVHARTLAVRPGPARRERLEHIARLGIRWLLDAQNDDGGWPTFQHSDEFMSAESSGVDLTAHALRALAAWQRQWQIETPRVVPPQERAELDEQISAAITRRRRIPCHSAARRRQLHPHVVRQRIAAEMKQTRSSARRSSSQLAHNLGKRFGNCSPRTNWLLTAEHAGGGWGPPRVPLDYSGTYRPGTRTWRNALAQCCTVEETALAVAALLPLSNANVITRRPSQKASTGSRTRWTRPPSACSPRLVFPRLWYHERLQGLLLASAALARATSQLTPQREAAATVQIAIIPRPLALPGVGVPTTPSRSPFANVRPSRGLPALNSMDAP